jgi:uncharacterized protein (DUF305 family)
MTDPDFLDEMVELIEGNDLEAQDKSFLKKMAKHHDDAMATVHKAQPKLTHRRVKQFAKHVATHHAIQRAYIAGLLFQAPPNPNPTPPPAPPPPPPPPPDPPPPAG